MKLQNIKPIKITVAIGIETFLISGLVMLWYGSLNADESWYLYASKLVYKGMVPYRDFAFTQMPLLPYLYGIPQLLFGQSLLVGRATSLFFTTLSFFLALRVARRYTGEVGASLTAIFLGTFFFGIYNLTIVKTYAVVTFFFMLTFFLLSSKLGETKKFSLSIIAAFLAGATRLSAMPFAITILFYLLWAASSNKIRLLIFGIFFLLSISTLVVLGADFESANWNLLTYHTSLWGHATPVQKIASILLMRPLSFIFGTSYTFYILLIFLFGLLLVRETSLLASFKAYLLLHNEIPAIAIGVFLFMLSHLQGGNWYVEYFVPAIFVCIVILSIGCAKIYGQLEDQRAAQTLIAGIVGFSLVIFPVQQLHDWMNIGNGQTPISEIQRVSEYVSGFTRPDDPIIVLGALWVSIESKRDPMPGYTMAQFSYWPFDDKNDARRLKLVNLEILQEDILSGQAKAIILTKLDWETIIGKNTVAICNALSKKYFLAFTTGLFGQPHATVYVYRLNDGSSFPNDSSPDPCMRR